MTKKRNKGRRVLFFCFFLILLATVVLYPNLSYRAARTYLIYARYLFSLSNSGVGYVYNRNVLNVSTLPWGIRKTELEFLISDRLLHPLDFRTPAIAELVKKTENTVSYRFDYTRTVVFYFNSRGRYYKAVERFEASEGVSTISKFSWYNSIWVGKFLFEQMNWNVHHIGTYIEVKWTNDALTSGYEHYTSERGFLRDFINIDGLMDGTISIREYPGLEIYHRREFDGMIVEHFLKQYSENPSLMTMERAYTSPFLSGD